MLNVILEHIERQGSYARILLVDFSAAFNTIQPHLMIRKLTDLGVGMMMELRYVNVMIMRITVI